MFKLPRTRDAGTVVPQLQPQPKTVAQIDYQELRRVTRECMPVELQAAQLAAIDRAEQLDAH